MRSSSATFYLCSSLTLFIMLLVPVDISRWLLCLLSKHSMNAINIIHPILSTFFSLCVSDFGSFLLASCDVYGFDSEKIGNISWNGQNASKHRIKTEAIGFFRYLYLTKRMFWLYKWSIFFYHA